MLHNYQHISNMVQGFFPYQRKVFVSTVMKVFFSSPERPQNCARDCGGRRENQGPKATAMARGILYQLCSFSSHFVQISASKSKQQKE